MLYRILFAFKFDSSDLRARHSLGTALGQLPEQVGPPKATCNVSSPEPSFACTAHPQPSTSLSGDWVALRTNVSQGTARLSGLESMLAAGVTVLRATAVWRRRCVLQVAASSKAHRKRNARWQQALALALTLASCVRCANSILSTGERAALLALYQSTNGTGWRGATGWAAFATNASVDPCAASLPGVNCSANGTSITCVFCI